MRDDMAVDGVDGQFVNDEASTESSATDSRNSHWLAKCRDQCPSQGDHFPLQDRGIEPSDLGDEFALNRSGMHRCRNAK